MREWIHTVGVLNELNDTRRLGVIAPPLPPARPRRKGGDGPRGGEYWVRNMVVEQITGVANEIVNLAGQVVLFEPERFGLTAEQVLEYLRHAGESLGVAASNDQLVRDYEALTQGTLHDVAGSARFWRASKMIFRFMIENGWAWVSYRPPSDMHIAVSPNAKRQLSAIAEHFPLVQVDTIKVTLLTNFDVGSGRHLELTSNRTFRFDTKDHPGFGNALFGMLRWAKTGEAAESNWLYFTSNIPPRELAMTGVSSRRMKVGGKLRYVILCQQKPVQPAEGYTLYRFPTSFAREVTRRLSSNRRTTAVYSERWFTLPGSEIEASVDGQWRDLGSAARSE